MNKSVIALGIVASAWPLLTMAQATKSPATTAQRLAISAPHPPASKIVSVKVYPGSATVERLMSLSANQRTAVFECIPAAVNVQTLQVWGDAGVRIGEMTVRAQPRAHVPTCHNTQLDQSIRALQDRKASVDAAIEALGYSTAYLKSFASGTGDGARVTPADRAAQNLTSTTQGLFAAGQEAHLKLYQYQRQQEELDKQLAPLLADQARSQSGTDTVQTVTVNLDATQASQLRLSYQVNGPSWSPSYRALLNASTRQLRIERLAQVAQTTGEDWRGVAMTLSTGQPTRNVQGRVPTPWQIGVQPPPETLSRNRALAAPAPVAAAASFEMKQNNFARPEFDVTVFEGSYATEFKVPQTLDVLSNAQRVSLHLGQTTVEAKVVARTSPRLEAAAYTVAQFAQPAGVWPTGKVQLYRDGAFVGESHWNTAKIQPANDALGKGTVPIQAANPQLEFSFGRDELINVTTEAERDTLGTTGFVSSRQERRIERGYVVHNRHKTPVTLQVLEAAPVSVDERIRIAHRFAPEPQERDYQSQSGMILWSQELGAGQQQRFTAIYIVDYPSDVTLQNQ